MSTARIRSVKPDILTDEEVWDLGMKTGLPILQSFEGLWMLADREGRFEWRPRRLGKQILPFWDGNFEHILDLLHKARFILRYEVGGKSYGLVRTFKKHQRPNNREPESILPPPPEDFDFDGTNSLEHAEVSLEHAEVSLEHAEVGLEHAEVSLEQPGTGQTNAGGAEDVVEPDISTKTSEDTKVLKPLEHAEVGLEHAEVGLEHAEVGLEHAQAEGKGREGNGKGKEGVCGGVTDPPRETAKKGKSPSARTFDTYCDAMEKRYGGRPEPNAKIRGQLAQFVQRMPAADAPAVAEHYVRSDNARYVASGHSIGNMLIDAEKLHLEWKTGRQTTAAAARRTDARADRGEEYHRVVEELRTEDEQPN